MKPNKSFRFMLIAIIALITSISAQDKSQKQNEGEPDELIISADRMEMQLDGKTVELTGNVRIEDSTMCLTSLKMMVYLTDDKEEKKEEKKEEVKKEEKKEEKKDEKKEEKKEEEKDATEGMKLQKIIAEGEVVLRKLDGTESAMSDHATYDVSDDTIVMTGNCSIVKGTNNLRGDRVTYNRKLGKINLEGGVITFKLKQGKDGTSGLSDMFTGKKEEKKDVKKEEVKKEEKKDDIKKEEKKDEKKEEKKEEKKQ